MALAVQARDNDDAVAWRAQPGPQRALLACPVEDVFFGGARGGGKTAGLLGDWLAHAGKHGASARGIFFRRTYPELEEVERQANILFPRTRASLNVQRRTWVWPNGATLRMRYLKRDYDADNFQGHEYTWVGFDEVTNYATPDALDKLRATLRSSAGVPCVVRSSGNPGGVGHNWVKARYIDPTPPYTPFLAEDGTQRVFIPSRLEDNILLMARDPDYWRRIEASAGGRQDLLRAWRYGDWDIVAGGMVDDLWKKDVHVISPFEIPLSWTIRRAMDWGSSRPFSVGWWAKSDGTQAPNGQHYPRGSVFRIAEWYGWNGKPNEGLRMLAIEVGRGIVNRERSMGLAGKIKAGPADAAMWAAENGVCIADDVMRGGASFIPSDKAPGSRKAGAEKLRTYLQASLAVPKEEPGLYVFDTCRHFIRTIPVLPRDQKNPDDVDCFVAGTEISTPLGPIPVEALRIGQYVDTPIGPRRVLKSGLAGKSQTVKILLSNGRQLEGTLDHKVYSQNVGLLPLCRLSSGDVLLTEGEDSWLNQSLTKASSFDDIQVDDILNVGWELLKGLDQVSSIVSYGNVNAELYPLGGACTTLTMMSEIMKLKIWNLCLRRIMRDTTTKKELATVGISHLRLCNGGSANEGKQLFVKILKKAVSMLPSENLRALIVASLLQHNTRVNDSAPQSANTDRIDMGQIKNTVKSVALRSLRNPTPPGKCKPVVTHVDGSLEDKKVYFLTVEQAHLFYANGVLSTNSDAEDHVYDETRYYLMTPGGETSTAQIRGV